MSVKTSVLMLSDTHGMTMEGRVPRRAVDVCIHAGDLTEESRLAEFRSTINLLRAINAPLTLVIAGNHDFTLDTASFKKKIQEIQPALEPELVQKFYGDYEEAKNMLLAAKQYGIHFLREGTHRFALAMGARLQVYASPYTPSLGDWGFQYRPHDGHAFNIEDGTDIVITHGPPRGILDRTRGRDRAGCPDLFAAVARAQPQMHCFGHIHEGWGAKLVAWRPKLSGVPSHLTDIDNDASRLIEQLSTLTTTKFDTTETMEEKAVRLAKYTLDRYCCASIEEKSRSAAANKTLFVNASIKGDLGDDGAAVLHLPWIVDLMLPLGKTEEETKS